MNGSPLPPALLYVEDEENDVFFLQRALTRAEVAVRFQSVCDGGKAIAYLAGEAPYAGRDLPDLVLLDLNLPVHSGFEVLEWLRRQPGLGELPVVVFRPGRGPGKGPRPRRQRLPDQARLHPATGRARARARRQMARARPPADGLRR